jgi:ParB-like chromosome segregation protein Spo0J
MNNDPISRIEWRDASSLNANEYNPNIVFTPELRLLERSILKTGWVQPVLITQDGTIIDGFHRHRLAQDSAKCLARLWTCPRKRP